MVRRQAQRRSLERLDALLAQGTDAASHGDDTDPPDSADPQDGAGVHDTTGMYGGLADAWLPAQDRMIDAGGAGRFRRGRRSGRAESSARRGDGGTGRHRTGAVELPKVRPHEPLVRPPSSLRGAEVGPSTLAVVGAIVVVLVAVLVFTARVWLAGRSAQPQPVPGSGATPVAAASSTAGSAASGAPGTAASAASGAHAGASGAGAAATAATGATAASSPGATPIAVHMVGQIRHPGVVQLAAGSRVQDAVAKAGGALPGADLAQVNLARLVVDGEQIRIPRPGETVSAPPAAPAAGAGTAGAGSAGGAGSAAGARTPVNLNTADATALDSLPGVGPVLAQRILDWRTSNGRFSSVDELGEVSGIGDKLMAQLRPLVTV